MIYIVAGSYSIAESIAMSRGLSPQEWRYVTDARALNGADPKSEVIWGAQCERRHDYRQLLAIVTAWGPIEKHHRKGTKLPKAVAGG